MPTPRALIKKKPGRKPMAEGMRNRTFRLSDADYALIGDLGGVNWIRAALNAERNKHLHGKARGPFDI